MSVSALQPNASGSRARILDAARLRFERFGFRRTGVSEIARGAGVAAGTLYRHFESKEHQRVLLVSPEPFPFCNQTHKVRYVIDYLLVVDLLAGRLESIGTLERDSRSRSKSVANENK